MVCCDVPANAWYVDAVQYVYDNDLMRGTSKTTFEPNIPLSRAMMAQILYNKAGKPAVTKAASFTDVSSSAWYADAIAWAEQNQVVSGIGNGKFAPKQAITRQEMAVMLHNNAGSAAVSGNLAFLNLAGAVHSSAFV